MTTDEAQQFPWMNDGENFIGCNYAFADLINNLPRLLTIEGKIHAETFVAACGAIAGFAAQQTLLAQKSNFSIETLTESTLNDGLFIVRAKAPDGMVVVNPKWWPTITGMVTNDAIQKVKQVLNPRTALFIAMESAVFALKVDPTTIKN